MATSQTKIIQTSFALIIVLAVLLWIFQDNILKIAFRQDNTKILVDLNNELKEETYSEKIENFVMKEYSKEQILLHIIEAETYYSYKDPPIQLLEIVAKTYDEFQEEVLMLSSNRAELFDSGEIFFKGEVNILTKSGVEHELDTEVLILLTESGQIKSDSEVTYLGKNEKMISESMEMITDSDIMYLNGKVKINQDAGAVINTTNLYVNHFDGNKIYQSEEQTIYNSKDNIISSEKGINSDMNMNLLNLLGNVNILYPSGSTIESYNLEIDQSDGGETYKSNELIHYQSTGVDIKAQKMHYDAVIKLLKLSDKVSAVYE